MGTCGPTVYGVQAAPHHPSTSLATKRLYFTLQLNIEQKPKTRRNLQTEKEGEKEKIAGAVSSMSHLLKELTDNRIEENLQIRQKACEPY